MASLGAVLLVMLVQAIAFASLQVASCRQKMVLDSKMVAAVAPAAIKVAPS
jgi:hypothetical protein